MTWLLTGGAGYIGAHIARALRDSGRAVVVLDDLSTGTRGVLPDDIPLVVADVTDRAAVLAVMREHGVTGVVHLAGKKAAGGSVWEPLHFYRHNVDGVLSVLEAMGELGVDKLVFSSSAAVYGTPDVELVTEDAPLRPESPYGETKLISEWLVRDVARTRDLRYVNLRYFNVVGAGGPELGDRSTHNLVPLVLRAIVSGRRPKLYGDDYPTRDGSCLRDYIHVVDLADAHLTAAMRMEDGPISGTYNIGRGEGSTVKEVLAAFGDVVGSPVGYDVVPRRAGDPAQIVGSAELARKELGWTPKYGLDEMVSSAWEARESSVADLG